MSEMKRIEKTERKIKLTLGVIILLVAGAVALSLIVYMGATQLISSVGSNIFWSKLFGFW